MTNDYETITDATGSVFEYHPEDPAIDCDGAWRFIGKLNGRTLEEFMVDLTDDDLDCFVCEESVPRCRCDLPRLYQSSQR